MYTRPTSVNPITPRFHGRTNGKFASGTRSSAVPYTDPSPAYCCRLNVRTDSLPPRNAASKYGKSPKSFWPPSRVANTGFSGTGSVSNEVATADTDPKPDLSSHSPG